jgi:hypothetical protein
MVWAKGQTFGTPDLSDVVWRGDDDDRFRVGGDAHKRLFCRMLLETHDPYRSAVMEWPKLDDAARHRLVSLPIWDIAVRTEGKARLRMLTYAATVADPLVRQALEMNGAEEGRHKEVLAHMVAAYGIVLDKEPAYVPPRDAEWVYMMTGYSECIDSFFAFGLFELARRSGYFLSELVETFEPVMQEECRRILFFVNWAAWHCRNLPWWRRPIFAARVAAVWVALGLERIETARDVGGGDNFTASGHESMGIDTDLPGLLRVCLVENGRRVARYDERLLRPKTMPRIARLILRLSSLRRSVKRAKG